MWSVIRDSLLAIKETAERLPRFLQSVRVLCGSGQSALHTFVATLPRSGANAGLLVVPPMRNGIPLS